MTERLCNGDQEAIFKNVENRKSRINIQNIEINEQVSTEKVIDDLSENLGIINFFAEHPNVVKIVSGIGAFGAVVSGVAMPVAAAENPSAYVSQQSESQDNKYDKALSSILLASNTTPAKESIKATLPKKVIVQIDKPYYMVTDPNVSGATNLLRKNVTCPSMISGRTMVSIELVSDVLGAKAVYDKKTLTTTVTKGTKIAKLKNGSKLMTITEAGKTKSVALDVPSQMNKDVKVVVPIRAVTEIFGSTVLYDGPTRSVLIGYTNKEKTDLFGNGTVLDKNMPADAIDLDATFKAFTYMINGTKTDCLAANVFAMTDKTSGVKVILSANDFEAADEKIDLAKKAKMTADQLKQEYINKSAINLIRKNLKKDDFVYVLNGKCFAFNGDKVRILSATAGIVKETAVTIPSNYAGDKIKWSEDSRNSGIFLVDKNEKIVVKFSQEKNNWAPEIKTMSQTEAINLASSHLSGGDLLNKNNFPYKTEVGSTNVVRVYSSTEKKADETALLDKVEKLCKSGDVMCYWNGNVCVLNTSSVGKYDISTVLTASIFDSNLKKTVCTYDLRSNYFFPSIVLNKDMGLCLTDGYRLTSAANSTGQFVELKKYVPTGTPEELAKRVELQVDKEARFNGKYDRKVWLNNSKNEKAICLLVGGEIGLPEDHLEAWVKGVQRCNEIDPELIDKCVRQYGLNIVCSTEPADDNGQDAAYIRLEGGGTIMYGVKSKKGMFVGDMAANVVQITIVETRGLSNEDHRFEKNGTYTLNTNNKAVETSSSIIEKEAYAATQIEIYAGVPVESRIKFDEHRKVTNAERDVAFASIGFNTSIRAYGKLTIEELTEIGGCIGSYNHYVQIVNGVR